MTIDRSPMWIGLADLLLCILSVVIVAVAPTKAKVDGVKPKAEFLITADWPVALDSDVDLWLVGPDKKPVFYGSREAGCASLDRDSLGFSTSQITLADGSMAQSESNKETTTIRCLAPGHYDVGVNLYSDRELAKGKASIPVRVEITGLNPQVTTVFAKDVALENVGQTINVASFDLTLGRPDQARRPAARADHRRLQKGQAVSGASNLHRQPTHVRQYLWPTVSRISELTAPARADALIPGRCRLARDIFDGLPRRHQPASMATPLRVFHMAWLLGKAFQINKPRRCVESRTESVIDRWTGLATSLRRLVGNGPQ